MTMSSYFSIMHQRNNKDIMIRLLFCFPYLPFMSSKSLKLIVLKIGGSSFLEQVPKNIN